MNLEDRVKQQLLSRGFSKEQLLNNRGLIGAAIDEAVLSVVKNLAIHDVSSMYCGCQQSQCYLMNGSYICATCNIPLGK